MVRAFEKMLDLPYGENPHQRAAYYSQVGARTHLLSNVSQLGGKQLSFNNLLDLDAARSLIADLDGVACVIVKHNNPCGVAVALDSAGRLPARVRVRSDVRVRRRDLPQPACRPRARGGARRAVHRGPVRARV